MKRAGAVALSLLSAPLNVHLLQALEDGPLPLIDLRRSVGSPPQSTMRVYSRTLVDLGTLERQRQAAFPGTVEYGAPSRARPCSTSARFTRVAAGSAVGPGRPREYRQQERDEGAGRGMVDEHHPRARGETAFPDRPQPADPADQLPLARAAPGRPAPGRPGRTASRRRTGTPYRATTWLRRAIVPLAAGAWWERRHLADPPLIGRLDVEAAFLLAIPLVELPDGLERQVPPRGRDPGRLLTVFAGVLITIEDGKVVSCSSRLEGRGRGWASGSAGTWMRRMSGQRRRPRNRRRLRARAGDRRLDPQERAGQDLAAAS